MSRVQLGEKCFDIQRSALAGFQRADPLVDVRAQLAEFPDMRQQLAANLLLVLLGENRYLRQRLFERFHHPAILAKLLSDYRYGSGCERCCVTQSRTASSSGVNGAL
jgi:hypothetical protein